MDPNHIYDALNVRQVGTGNRTMVLGSEMGTDQCNWDRILPHFTPTYRVVLYDLACTGSVSPEHFDSHSYSTLDRYVDDLLNVINGQGIQNFVYVGHGFSAMIGIIASIRQPETFSKLILLGASPLYVNKEDYNGGYERSDVMRVVSVLYQNYVHLAQGKALVGNAADVPEAISDFSRTLFNMRPDIALYAAVTLFNSDVRDQLGLVTVPTCVIQTENDVPASAEYLIHHLGGITTMDRLDSGYRLPQIYAPVQLAEVIRRALPP